MNPTKQAENTNIMKDTTSVSVYSFKDNILVDFLRLGNMYMKRSYPSFGEINVLSSDKTLQEVKELVGKGYNCTFFNKGVGYKPFMTL